MDRGNKFLKFLDRYLGTILLALLVPLRWLRRGNYPDRINSIGLLKTAAIGDTVLFSAVLSDIRASFPNSKIIVFCGASNFEYVKLLHGMDKAVNLPLKNPITCLKIIRNSKFDIFIDFDSWPRISAVLSALTRSSVRIGFKTANQHRHFMQDISVLHSNRIHELENYRSLLTFVTTPAMNSPQEVGHPWANGSNVIIFHLWPSGIHSHLKEWPIDRWINLAQRLRAIGDYTFLVTGGVKDIQSTERFMKALPEGLRGFFTNAAGKSFKDTLLALQHSRLLVSVNTGVMHVGAAMGVPTVGLHGPTNPLRWGPIGSRTKSILSSSTSAGSLNLGFEYNLELDYMSGIDPDEVFSACSELMLQYP